MSNILVIGSTGMVGSRIVNEAVRRGHTVTAASRSGKPDRKSTRLNYSHSDRSRMPTDA